MLNKWSKEEIELLKEKYIYLEKSELIKLFPNKTVKAISDKIYNLKLKKDNSPSVCVHWTPVEINILKEKYANTDKEELLKLLYKREWKAVCLKALKLNLKRDKEQIEKTRRKTNLEKFGVEFLSQSKEIQDKIKENCLAKYGIDHHTKTEEYKKGREENCLKKYGVKTNLQLEDTKNKIKQTNLKKYGVENPQQSEEIKEKTRQTNLKKYGVVYTLQDSTVRQKIKDTYMAKYGVDCNLKVSEVKDQIKQTNLDRYGHTCALKNEEIRDKQKKTCLEKFGTEYATSSEEVQEKIRKTNKDKRGIEYPFQLLEIQNKVTQSKTENGTHGTSSEEPQIHELIKKIYPELTIIDHYNLDERYPFICDFYIKELDTFIEYQGTWTHNKSPYDGINIPKKWEGKIETNKYYKSAFNTYTVRDPMKRNYAEKSNLNFLEIWPSDFKKKEKWLTFLLVKLNLPLKYRNQTLKKEFESIGKSSNFLDNAIYNKIVEHFQPHFYKEERKLWNFPEIREKLVENRALWKNKDYTELTNKQLLQGFKISGIHTGYSFFSTSWIRGFIEKYKISSIYDPCMGWGQRLLGAKDITYIGNDLCPETVAGNIKISEYFNMKNKIFYNMPAEGFIPYDSYEAVFTCPPYFKIEKYGGKDTSASKYPKYADWLNIWWREVIRSSVFNRPKYFAFVINNKYKEDMLKVCLEEGLSLIEELKVGSNKLNHFQRKANNSYKGESLLVLSVPSTVIF